MGVERIHQGHERGGRRHIERPLWHPGPQGAERGHRQYEQRGPPGSARLHPARAYEQHVDAQARDEERQCDFLGQKGKEQTEQAEGEGDESPPCAPGHPREECQQAEDDAQEIRAPHQGAHRARVHGVNGVQHGRTDRHRRHAGKQPVQEDEQEHGRDRMQREVGPVEPGGLQRVGLGIAPQGRFEGEADEHERPPGAALDLARQDARCEEVSDGLRPPGDIRMGPHDGRVIQDPRAAQDRAMREEDRGQHEEVAPG